jgi:hypothetical protein
MSDNSIWSHNYSTFTDILQRGDMGRTPLRVTCVGPYDMNYNKYGKYFLRPIGLLVSYKSFSNTFLVSQLPFSFTMVLCSDPHAATYQQRGASERSYFSQIDDHDICNHSVYSLIKQMITFVSIRTCRKVSYKSNTKGTTSGAETRQWRKEKGQTTIHNTLHRPTP